MKLTFSFSSAQTKFPAVWLAEKFLNKSPNGSWIKLLVKLKSQVGKSVKRSGLFLIGSFTLPVLTVADVHSTK